VSEYQAYAEPTQRALPDSVRTLRVLLYVWAGLTLLITVGFLISQAVTAETLGAFIWTIWPGVAAVFIARGIRNGGRKRFWWTVVAGAFGILGALAAIGEGDPRGVTELILPVAVLITVTRPTARAFIQPQPH
jgi:hypothetical protein